MQLYSKLWNFKTNLGGLWTGQKSVLHHHSSTLCYVSKLMRNMRTSMIGVFKFLNIVNVLHSKDAIMGRRREEKSPWFSSRCRLPESLNKKTNKQTTKSSLNARYASCPFSSSLKYDSNPHIYDDYDSSRVKTSAACSVLWLCVVIDNFNMYFALMSHSQNSGVLLPTWMFVYHAFLTLLKQCHFSPVRRECLIVFVQF